MFLFLDRRDAGAQVAAELLDEPLIKAATQDELLVLSIPRGGVVVGATVAEALGCAHDLIIVKKIGYPGQPEFAIGAVAEDGVVILNEIMLPFYRQKANYVEQAIERTKMNMEQSIMKFRQGRTLDLRSRVVILVDDGIATGETMKAAIECITSIDRPDRPKKVVAAVPVCSSIIAPEIEELVDKFICIAIPERFWAVSQFYWEFNPVDDEQVIEYLSRSRELSSS